MSAAIDIRLHRDLDSMLSAASFGLAEVHKAYQQGELHPTHIDWVLSTRDSLAQMLAHFEDGAGYKTLPDDYRDNATGAMRCFEEDASALHQALVLAVGAAA